MQMLYYAMYIRCNLVIIIISVEIVIIFTPPLFNFVIDLFRRSLR